jgi:methionyl-tRNA formyltransferase
MPLKIAFIGCVSSSRVVLQTLLSLPLSLCEVVCIMTMRSNRLNSDHVDLGDLARASISLLYVDDVDGDTAQADWLMQSKPDLIFCVGWSRLLGNNVLQVAPRGVVGFHPSALPANRGRHPLVWALALGLPETASTFFLMDSGADSGPLLSQLPIKIECEDDAASLYAKVLALLPRQVETIVRGLKDGSLIPQPQDVSRATYWRKRTAADGRIDWRMEPHAVRNLVRALAHPYPGAHFTHQGREVKVWKCIELIAGRLNDEPGKVLAVDDRSITVRCGRGAVRLIDHELSTLPAVGDYL